MKYGALLGWGICIYAIMALVWSGLVMYGFAGTIVARGLELFVLIVVATIAGRSLRFHSWKDILPYPLCWAIVVGFLDVVYSVPFGGWEIYSDWNIWVGYALVVLVPLIGPYTHMRHGTMEA